jgi:hypothetical protein
MQQRSRYWRRRQLAAIGLTTATAATPRLPAREQVPALSATACEPTRVSRQTARQQIRAAELASTIHPFNRPSKREK